MKEREERITPSIRHTSMKFQNTGCEEEILMGRKYIENLFLEIERSKPGTSLLVHRLKLHASTAGYMGLIPDVRTKILHAAWHNQKKFLKIIIVKE